MNIITGILIGLLTLMFLVTAHEFGHFIMARRNGVRVLEFGICFPPRMIAWKRGKDGKWHKLPKSEWGKPQDSLILSLNWLPIGGFCQMDGESAADTKKGTFGKANFWQKTKILFGGVAINWLISIVILTILAWTGMPTFLDNQFTITEDTTISKGTVKIANILKDSPAEQAGFQSGDEIIKINDLEINNIQDVTTFNSEHAGEEANFKVLRTEQSCEENCTSEISLVAKLNPKEAEYALGIEMQSAQSFSYSTWSAPIVGIGLTAQMTGETFKGVGELIWNVISGVARQFSPDDNIRAEGKDALGSATDSVSGPVGIIGVIFPSFASAGITNLAFLTALISVSLACMNVLPIPALDGGRWLLIAIYKLRKKKLTKEREEQIVSKAFMILLAIAAIVTVLDIIRLF